MKTKNRLIAEFMGFKLKLKTPECDYYNVPKGTYNSQNASMGAFHFHDSWDWLMPVVRLCHKIGESKEKEFPEDKHLDDPTGWRSWSYRRVDLSTDINLVYRDVIRFINFYNKHKL